MAAQSRFSQYWQHKIVKSVLLVGNSSKVDNILSQVIETPRANFPATEIGTLPTHNPSSRRVWQKGDPIVEPQGVYRLPNGKLVLSRDCP